MLTKQERLDALLREMDGLQAISDSLTEDQSKRYDAALVEAESLRGQIARDARAAALSAEMRQSAGRVVPDLPAGEVRGGRVEVGEENGGQPLFRNVGEFMQAMARRDANWEKFLNGACAPEGPEKRDYVPVKTSDTGVSVMIPDRLYGQIVEVKGYEEILYPRATKIPADEQPDASINILAMDQGSGGYFNGVTWAWIEESGTITPSDHPTKAPVKLTPHEVSGSFKVSNKTLRNAAAHNAWMTQKFGESFMAMRDRALIIGAGTTLPLGILNSSCKLVIPRNTVSTIKYADVVRLRQSVPASLLRECIWLCASDGRETLESMVDGGNRLIFGPGDVSQGLPETLRGLPLFFYDHAALGALSDLALVHAPSYFVKEGYTLTVALSEHVEFLNANTVVRMMASFDGVCPIADPVTEANGHIVSPVAVLKAATT